MESVLVSEHILVSEHSLDSWRGLLYFVSPLTGDYISGISYTTRDDCCLNNCSQIRVKRGWLRIRLAIVELGKAKL